MDNLTKRDQPDRSKINMSEDFELKYWLKALGVSRDELKRAVGKVGTRPPPFARNWVPDEPLAAERCSVGDYGAV